MREMNASAFKAKCLAILDEVAETGETVRVLKRGRPVAELVPSSRQLAECPQRTLEGAARVKGDIVAPAVPAESWDAERAVLLRDESDA